MARLRERNDAEDLFRRGMAGDDLFPAALAERAHAVLPGALGQRARALPLEDELVQLVVEPENLEKSDPAAVARAAAAVAPDRGCQRFDLVRFGGAHAENGEGLDQLDLADRLR